MGPAIDRKGHEAHEIHPDRLDYFSSQYGREDSISYAVTNIVGPPTRFPRYGDFQETAVFRTYGVWWKTAPEALPPLPQHKEVLYSDDIVVVTWQGPVYIKSVQIYETYNPGTVVRIMAQEWIKDSQHSRVQGKWYELWRSSTNQPEKMDRVINEARIFEPVLNQHSILSTTLSIEFAHNFCDYYTEIDSVKVIGGADFDVDSKSSQNKISTISEKMGSLNINHSHSEIDQSESGDEDLVAGYFSRLPLEILYKIFYYLNLEDLCRLALVCKLFHEVSSNPIHEDYQILNLQPFWHRMTHKSMELLSNRCTKIKTLNLSWICESPPLALFKPTLKRLDLSACQFSEDDWIGVMTTLGDLKDLQCLSLSSTLHQFNIELYTVICHLKNLTWLNLYRTGVSAAQLNLICKCCQKLEFINIGSCPNLDNDYHLGDLAQCHNLRGLDLWRAQFVISAADIELLTENCPNIESLDLGWCKLFPGIVSAIATGAPKLIKLFLTATRGIHGPDLRSLAKNCPNLEMLDVLGNGEIDEWSVSHLLQKCKNMRFLDISFCTQLSSHYKIALRRDYLRKVEIKDSFT